MVRRGPRGDLSRATILAAADALVDRRGGLDGVSLRAVAGALGVAANALYTYFPSRAALVHELADARLGRLRAGELAPHSGQATVCAHCALTELFGRATALYAAPGTLALLKAQPVLGPESFRLSETVMALCGDSDVAPRDAHDLIMGWFYGSASLAAEGWATGTDTLRAAGDWVEGFPLVSARPDPEPAAQFAAILRGLGIAHRF